MSTNEWVKCPYNHTHTMPQSTLQWHLVRCSDKRKNADNFSTCPYNATHIIIKSELTKHVMNCPDKKLFADTEEIVSHIKSIKENSSYVHTRMPWEADTDFWEIDDTKLVPGETPKETEYKNTSRPQKKKNAKKKKNKTDNNDNDNQSVDGAENEYESNDDPFEKNIVPPIPTIQDSLKPNGLHKNVSENSLNNIISKVTTDITSNVDSIEITLPTEDRSNEKEKKLKVLQKKLKQIVSLEEKITKGEVLDIEQKAKINRKRELEDELAALKI